MRHTILNLFALLFLGFSHSLNAQIIYGTVTDQQTGDALMGATITVQNISQGVFSDSLGYYELKLAPGVYQIKVQYAGYETFVSASLTLKSSDRKKLNIKLQPSTISLDEVVVTAYGIKRERKVSSAIKKLSGKVAGVNASKPYKARIKQKSQTTPLIGLQDKEDQGFFNHNTEGYDHIVENTFKEVKNDPLSTFSIDVDRASYANVRRFINNNQLPPKDAVRIEELINYFDYDYPQPKGNDPFAIHTEVAKCPWQPENWLLQIGLQGRELQLEEAPPSNLVFLLDVSGSMNYADKLPLLKQAFRLLVDNLRAEDRVAIAVYAGAAGLVLPSTPGNQKKRILKAIDQLNAGGSTAGGAGIQLAYQTAMDNFMKRGNNRVILATDGDFNVGLSSDGELVRMIEEKRKAGVFLTVLGFGTGNYQDAKMEKLADKGNGNYAYIDNLLEAKKVLVNEMSGTLYTIAKDVKIQIEFNPQQIKGYRLIGYENRVLNKEDFNDDTKDAGELGAGHTVTALYELIPSGAADPQIASIDPLKYQEINTTSAAQSDELMTVKFRYKKPDENKSKLIIHTLEKSKVQSIEKASENLKFSSAVAAFGMLLRDSKFKGNASFEAVIQRAKAGKGIDLEDYRAEFIRMTKVAALMK